MINKKEVNLFRIFWKSLNRVFGETYNHHVSETNNTDDTSKNSPVTKYHSKYLQKDTSIINLLIALGQHQRGFSLVEVLVVASIMGFLAMVGMNMMDTMKRNQSILEKKFAAYQLHIEITDTLKKAKNCEATFKEVDLTGLEADKPIKNVITHVNRVIESEEDGPQIQEVFKIGKEGENLGLGIKSFDFLISKNDFYDPDIREAYLSLRVDYDLKVKPESPAYRKVLPMKLILDEDQKIVGCSSGGTSSSGQLAIADSVINKELSGLSGHEACKKINKSCLYVESLNYASLVYGQNSLSNLCQINYNKTTNGVEKGSPKSNKHPCEVLLGLHETYKINQKNSGVTCKGIFTAVCN